MPQRSKTSSSSAVSKSSAASKSGSSGGSSSRSAAKRLIKELGTWNEERQEERGIERLGPVSDDDLMTWEAVINGRDVGSGYDSELPILALPRH